MSEELNVPSDLGRRIVRAARMAVAIHYVVNHNWSTDFGRQPTTGRAESGEVMDDLSIRQTVLPSPWTLAGDDPAGSFIE